MKAENGIPAHGGQLINRRIAFEQDPELPAITLDEVAICDLNMIADGALSPLDGFMSRDDYDSVVGDMRLADGTLWSIPITLPVAGSFAMQLSRGGRYLLQDEAGTVMGRITVGDTWQPDLEREAREVYKTIDRAHPGVARLDERGEWYIGGSVEVFDSPDPSNGQISRTPRQTRAEFASRGWQRIVAFQTRNPVHRAHEYIQKCALEMVDGLLLHPLVGQTKSDDVPADVRLRSYRALLDNYYPENRVVLSGFPAAMRYAGPREAVFHAIARKNYGCTHFIVGRDHAGVGNYYGTYDAQRIFDTIDPQQLGITPLFFEHTFFCRRCDAIVSQKTCPHSSDQHVVFSGTQIRDMLRKGERLPAQYSRPEVVDVLVAAMSGNGNGHRDA
jgi:sulfate adenylyltransferase